MMYERYSRGQTIIELVVAMPIVLFVLFAVIYIARYGVLSERAELALRYGGITGFQNSTEYSAANIYSYIGAANPLVSPAPCSGAPTTILTGGGPFPGPSPAPFFQPDTDNTTPSSTCTSQVIGFGGAQFLATHYLGTTIVNVSAGIDVPSYLHSLMGSTATVSTTAQFAHAAYPGLILYCSTEVYDRVWNAIYADNTVATPPPGPTNNGTCHN